MGWRDMKPCPGCGGGKRPPDKVERIELMPGVFMDRCDRCKGATVVWPDTDPRRAVL
jgi:hypothetical protein